MLPGSIKLLEDRRAPAVLNDYLPKTLTGGGAGQNLLTAQLTSSGGKTYLSLDVLGDFLPGGAAGTTTGGQFNLGFLYNGLGTLSVTAGWDDSDNSKDFSDTLTIDVSNKNLRVENVTIQYPAGFDEKSSIYVPAGVDWDGPQATDLSQGTMDPEDVVFSITTGSAGDTISIATAYQATISTGDGDDLVSFGGRPLGTAPATGVLAGGAVVDLGMNSSDRDSVSTGDGSDYIIYSGNASVYNWGGVDTVVKRSVMPISGLRVGGSDQLTAQLVAAGGDTFLNLSVSRGVYQNQSGVGSGQFNLGFLYSEAGPVGRLSIAAGWDDTDNTKDVSDTIVIDVSDRNQRIENVTIQYESGFNERSSIYVPAGVDWDGPVSTDGSGLKGTMNPEDVIFSIATGSGGDSISIAAAYRATISTGDGNDRVSFGSQAFGASPVGGLSGGVVLDLGSNSADNDSASTGDGSDSIVFGGDATLLTWGGNDTIKISASGASTQGSSVLAGAGQDSVILGQGNDVVFAGDDDDLITVGLGNNTVYGGRGNDVISALGGADFLSGEEGNDTIYGSSTLSNLAQGDTLVGGDGADVIFGGRDADCIDAGAGSDTIYGRGGQDRIYGGSGADFIQDGLDATDRPSGSQSIFAGDGDDTVIGGSGSDTIDFGTGVDYLLYGNPSSGIKVDSDNYLDGRINANIGGASSTVEKGTLGTDWLLNAPDYLAGTSFSDTVVLQDTRMSLVMGDGDNSVSATGSFDDQYITLGSGRDFVFVDGGDDFVRSGAGDDTLIGGSGNDTLLGEDGDDFIIGDFTSGTGTAADLVLSSIGISDGGGLVTVGDWTLSTASGSDSVLANWLAAVRASAGNGKDSILAGLGDDIVLSGGGDDTVDGGIGSDVIFGGAGNDLLGGGALDTVSLAVPDGGDYLFGEAGNDTLLAGDRDRAVLGGDENGAIPGDRDVAWFSDFTFGSFINLAGWFRNGPAYGLVSGVTYVVGSPYSDTIVGDANANLIFGGDGADSLVGGAGDDLIFGGSMPAGFDSLYSGGVASDKVLLLATINAADLDGDDTILGGDGDDCINAGNGNNSVDGGDGDDSLSFGLGMDTVVGGGGNDTLLGFISSDTKQISQADTLVDTSGDNLVSIGFDATGVVLAPASVTAIRTSNSVVLGSGDDTVFAGYLSSRITDSGGSNSLQLSGWGDSVALSGDQSGSTVFGGIGNDSVVFGASTGNVTVSLSGAGGTDRDFIDANLLVPTSDVLLGADLSVGAGAHFIAQTVVGTSKADYIVMSANGSAGSIVAGDGNDLVQLGFWVNGSSGVASANRGGTVFAGNGQDTVFTGILGLSGRGNELTASGLSTGTRDFVVYTGTAPVAGDTLGTELVGGDSVFLAAGADTVYVAELDAAAPLGTNRIFTGFGPDFVLAGRGNHSIVTGLDSGDSVLLRTTADGTPVYARDDGEYLGRNSQQRLGDYVRFLSAEVDEVYLELGDGNDVVEGSVLDAAQVTVYAGRGVDCVSLGNADNTVVTGSRDVDDVNPGLGFAMDSVFTGDGNDSVTARSSDVGVGIYASVGDGDNTVRGTQNPDCIFAGDGGDLFDGLNGGTYAPNLTTIGTDQQGDFVNLAVNGGGTSGDTVLDGYGDHTVITGDGDDIIDFGASYMGNVSVMTADGDDSVVLGDGWRWEPPAMDQTLAVGGSGTVSLGDGNDTVVNVQNKQVESSPSKIFGEGGDDYIVFPVGVAGKADSLFGGDGNDYLNGVPGTDPRVFPATSVSTSSSVAVAGFFDGGDGSNTIQGTAFTDTIILGVGDAATSLGNFVHNGAGQERILGGIYNDTIIMFASASVSVDAGAGDDWVMVTTASSATVNAGDGVDTVMVTAGTSASVVGGDGDDRLSVTAQTSATVVTGDGDNSVTLSAGGVGSVVTGSGDNRMTLTTGGAFNYAGGDGDDVMSINSAAGVTLNLGAGNDSVTVTAGGTTSVDLGDGNDAATVFGGPGGTSLNTGATVLGGIGNDSIAFHTQTVGLVNAGDGNDFVSVYGPGLATISLGAGDDEFWLPTLASQGSTVATSAGKWIFGQDGNDFIVAGPTLTSAAAANTESQTIDAGAGDDTVHAWGGSDLIFLGSGVGRDWVFAGAGDDTVIAGGFLGTVNSGASTLYDVTFDPADLGDTILGGGGIDMIFGGVGGDLIAADYVRLTDGSPRMVQVDNAATASSLGFVDNASMGNTILGGGGSDTVFGAAGDDVIISHGIFGDLKGVFRNGAPDIVQVQHATAGFTAGSELVNLSFGIARQQPVGYLLAGPLGGTGLISPLGSQIQSSGGVSTGDGRYRMTAFRDGTQAALAMSDTTGVGVVLVNVDGESLDTAGDFIFAQGGNDIVLGSAAGDVIDLGTSSVLTAIAPSLATLAPASLTVDGVAGWNIGVSDAGSDTFFAGTGSDTVLTFDTVSAGSGDLVSVGGGWDYVRTGRGDDSINLGNGADSATTGNLALTGGGGDRVVGGLGSDTVFTYNTGAAAFLRDTVTISTGSASLALGALSSTTVSGMLVTGNGVQVGSMVIGSGALSRTVGALLPDATQSTVPGAATSFIGTPLAPASRGVAATDGRIVATFWNVAAASTDTGAGGDTVLLGGGQDYAFTGAGAMDSLGSDFVDVGAGGTVRSFLTVGDSISITADVFSTLMSGNLVYTGGQGRDSVFSGANSDTVMTVLRSESAVAADTLGDVISSGGSADFAFTGAGDDSVVIGSQTGLVADTVGQMGNSVMTGGGRDTIVGESLRDSIVTGYINEIAVSARGVFGSRYLFLTKSETLYGGIKVGDLVTGPFIPPNTRVAAVSSQAVELTQELYHPVIPNLGDSLINGFNDTVGTDDTVRFISTGATLGFASFGANVRFWSVDAMQKDLVGDSIIANGGSDFVITGVGNDTVDLANDFDAGVPVNPTLSVQAWADSVADSNSVGGGFDLTEGVYTRGNYFLSAGGGDSILGGNYADTIVTYLFDAGSDTVGDTIRSGDDADFIQTGVGNDFILFGNLRRPAGGGDVFETSSRSYAFDVTRAGLGDASGRGTYGNFVSSGGGRDTISHGVIDEYYPERSDTATGGNLADTLMTFGGSSTVSSSLAAYWMRVRAQGINPVVDYAGDTVGDSVESGGGGDYVFSGRGDDTLLVGGSVRVDLGKVNRINSGGGRDSIIGGEGDDRVEVYVGSDPTVDALGDIVDLRGGNDTVSLGIGNDFVQLGAGNDYAFISRGLDTVVCGDGDDEVQGNPEGVGSGGDSILGGAGADRIKLVGSGAASPAVVTLRLGDGDEYLSVNYRAFIDLGPGVLQSVDARKAPGAVTILGGYGSDTILGSRFADSIVAGDGNNYVGGGGGSDTIEVGSGSDTVFGDAGNDLIRFRVQGFGQPDGDRDDYLYGGDGDDTIYGGSGSDYVNGGAGRDLLFGDLSMSRNAAQSGDGNDTIIGGAGDDSMFGGGGRDVMDGGVGNDYLVGGAGSDVLKGGAGNDTLLVDSATDSALGDSGRDWLLVPVRASKMSYSGIERLTKY